VHGGTIEHSTDFNRATQAYRQAGSSFKPLVYALAFQKRGPDGGPAFTAAHAVPNAPRTFEGTGGWRPRNVGGEYTSTACLAYALAWSQNIATASLLEEAGGPKALVALAARLGFDTRTFPLEMGLALGQAEVHPLDMARFASTLVRGGRLASGSPVLVARDAAGNVRVAIPPDGAPVIEGEAAALTAALMRLVIEVGTGGAARGAGGFPGYAGPAIGKTGTTDSEKDLWFVGATPLYAGAVWLGYDEPRRIGATASDLASPLWGWWMREVHLGHGQPDFPDDHLARKAVCYVSGGRPHAGCPIIHAPFRPGTEPKAVCTLAHVAAAPELDEEGNPVEPKKHESLWKRRAAEEEAAASSHATP
jgi:penicillin-binding protein 1A